MAKGIQIMVGDTKCGSPLAIFCIPTHFVAAPLAIFCIPTHFVGIHYLALHRPYLNWESWKLLAVGWQFRVQNLDQLYVQGPILQKDLSPDLDLNLRLWS